MKRQNDIVHISSILGVWKFVKATGKQNERERGLKRMKMVDKRRKQIKCGQCKIFIKRVVDVLLLASEIFLLMLYPMVFKLKMCSYLQIILYIPNSTYCFIRITLAVYMYIVNPECSSTCHYKSNISKQTIPNFQNTELPLFRSASAGLSYPSLPLMKGQQLKIAISEGGCLENFPPDVPM